jgi:exonuclease VII small subunit
MVVQEARYEAAMKDLNKAQAQLDEKQRELDAVQAIYDQALREKQVCSVFLFHVLLLLLVQELLAGCL